MGKITGRKDPKANDLFFTCSLIDYIARKTKNKRSAVVNTLGRTSISKIYDLADVYHSDNIDGIAREKKIDIIDALFEAYNSFASDKIDDYNSSLSTMLFF